jgi:hypothetical protein
MATNLLQELVVGSPTWNIAYELAIISVILAAIALGLGRAFSSRKIWAWGAEELGQTILNVALLAVLAGFVSITSGIISDMFPASMGSACTKGLPADSHSALNLTFCYLTNASNTTQNAISSLLSQSYKMGLLASLTMNLNVVTAQPYQALGWPAKTYAEWAQNLASIQALIEANRQFLLMMATSGFALFLPLGLLLRLFFATRRIGGAIIAGAISFYIIYPIALASLINNGLIESSGALAISSLDANDKSLAALSNSIDWDQPGVIAAMMKNLDGQQLSAKAADVYSPIASFQAALTLYAIIYPLIAFIISLSGGIGIAGMLGSELRLDLFEMA